MESKQAKVQKNLTEDQIRVQIDLTARLQTITRAIMILAVGISVLFLAERLGLTPDQFIALARVLIK